MAAANYFDTGAEVDLGALLCGYRANPADRKQVRAVVEAALCDHFEDNPPRGLTICGSRPSAVLGWLNACLFMRWKDGQPLSWRECLDKGLLRCDPAQIRRAAARAEGLVAQIERDFRLRTFGGAIKVLPSPAETRYDRGL